MRRTLSAVALASLCACSFQTGSSQRPVAGTPPPPVASSTIESTLTQLPSSSLAALPPELAFSMHYRRSAASHKALDPARKFIVEAMRDAEASASDTQNATQVMDALAAIERLDVFVAAPTTKLTRVEDLEQLIETGCLAVRVTLDKGSVAATMLASPPSGFEQQIAPLTYKVTETTSSLSSPGCAKMPAFADADAVAKTGDAIAGKNTTFVESLQPGHALFHDEVLWKEIATKYREGVNESLSSGTDEALAKKYLDRIEGFVTHLNLWKVMRESNAMVASWSFLPNGDWNMEMVYSADSAASAEIIRRTSVGSLDSQILFLSDSASQEIKSVTDGSKMAMSVAFKNPDLSTLLVASGGASSLSAFMSMAIAAGIQERQNRMLYAPYDDSMWEPGSAPDSTIDLPGFTPPSGTDDVTSESLTTPAVPPIPVPTPPVPPVPPSAPVE